MKIIYKVSIAKLRSDEDFTEWRFFDTYDQVRDWLETYYGQDRKLTKLAIDTMMLCDGCGEYDEPTCYSFIKSDYNTLMAYCITCAPNYQIDKKPFMKEEDNGNKQ